MRVARHAHLLLRVQRPPDFSEARLAAQLTKALDTDTSRAKVG